MAYKDILVHLDPGGDIETRAMAAARLAAAQEAHLTGLFVRTPPHIPPFVQAQLGSEVMNAQMARAREAAEAAEKTFREVAERYQVPHEWRDTEGSMVEMVGLHARYADLTVVGQANPDTEEADYAVPDHLVMDGGRPVLVLPHSGTFPVLGQHILVGWSASRESARAVHDAMPLLTRAEKVTVLAVNPTAGIYGELPGADIARHLARHGVNAEAEHIHSDDVDVGSTLMTQAGDRNADMVVMGAYGHSRLRELVLGGATQQVLRYTTRPVFMSH